MAKKEIEWVERWGMWQSKDPVLPGVWRRKAGGHIVRSRVVDPKTGKMTEIKRSFPDEEDAKRAFTWLTAERERVRRGGTEATTALPTFRSFATLLFQKKVADGTIASAAGRAKWAHALEHHLLVAPWSEWYVDKVTFADLSDWRDGYATREWSRRSRKSKDGRQHVVVAGKGYKPHTINSLLAIARVIWKAISRRHSLPNPMDGVEDFPTDRHPTYTHEQPNALTDEEVGAWLEMFHEMYPQFFAMTYLGFVLGQRPSTLRPIRRKGDEADLKMNEGLLLVRRSNTEGQEVMVGTKTAKEQKIKLPRVVLDVLAWHMRTQLRTEWQQESDLLFPTDDGGIRTRTCLDKPFRKVTDACGLTKRISPRAMRRTFQDLSRAAHVEGIVAKAISGHATDAMRIHYSTAQTKEVEQGIGRIAEVMRIDEFAERRKMKA